MPPCAGRDRVALLRSRLLDFCRTLCKRVNQSKDPVEGEQREDQSQDVIECTVDVDHQSAVSSSRSRAAVAYLWPIISLDQNNV
eukprot:6183037-Pleurochrysis_carterae.AAC.3